MNLADFEKTGAVAYPRLVTRVPDKAGAEEFELAVTGPRALVERMLADATIEVAIDSKQTEARMQRGFESAQKERRSSLWEAAGLNDVDALFKPQPEALQRKATVLASVRPVKGEGTPFAFSVSGFFLGTGVSLVFLGSWVNSTFATVLPASGDQDLFLHLFNPLGPIVSASIFGGTRLDIVAFGSPPPFAFLPFFRVRGFAAGVCSSFTAAGV